ncbi:MAG TPA: 4-aminobutyrate--2-oxoglutarate transaminase [Thermoanaerobaculia bacterium]|jgi:4-aminobutyrate aminotransferase/(S)-3-amino-2-methylpropionate transaminase|nr:4-aminobutyrate--2-oxoglutarate transaminase [Thermoanaerobaculia bacterium]
MTETAVASTSNSIVLVTDIPGPRSRSLWARREKATPRGLAHTAPIFIDRAEGALLHDVDGNALIDFAGGIGTLNFGHTNPAVVDAVREQVGKLTHTCFTVVGYEPYLLLAERLNALVPGAFEKKTMLANSGAEAVENAVKIARHATGRQGVVVFEHGFHGRTLLGLSMTSKVKPYKVGFGPYAPEIYRMPFPYEYRRDAPSTAAAYEREIREFFASYVAPEQVACVVMELVTGEGGFIPAPPAFVEALYKVCRGNGILFVDDEIQTGFGRTGRMFACEHYSERFEFAPDLVITAKSMGGGLPISAVTGRAEIMDSPQAGGLGGTYLGNPVACAAALAILDVVENEGMVERARRLGAKVEARFAQLASRYSRIGDARGLGAMRALEFVKDRVTKEPDKEFTQRVIQNAYKSGLLLLSAGTAGNIIRTLMPFVITDDQLDEGMAVLERVIASS